MARNLDDWLENYIKFTQNSEPPRLYHLWTGIVAISSCLQRKCWLGWGHSDIFPNLYVILVGPSGGRKGTAMKIAKDFLYEIGVQLSSDSLGSIQTLYKELMDAYDEFRGEDGLMLNHRSLSVWSEEFQVFLRDRDPMLIANLTDLFDCPKRWKYSTLKRGLEDLSSCWLTLFGAITPTLLQSSLSRDAVAGGLISRIVFVVGYGKAKKVPIPFLSKEEQKLRALLTHDLEQIKQLSGPFRPTEKYVEEYSKWYVSNEATAGVDSDKFVGYNERRALHLQKLCMIMSASQRDDMLITQEHFSRALYILKHTEREMPNAFYGLGRGLHSGVLSDLMQYIQANGTVSWHQIIKRFQLDALPHELETYLGSLEQIGVVKRERSTTNKVYFTAIEEKIKEDTEKYLKDTLFCKLDENKGEE